MSTTLARWPQDSRIKAAKPKINSTLQNYNLLPYNSGIKAGKPKIPVVPSILKIARFQYHDVKSSPRYAQFTHSIIADLVRLQLLQV
jgi:hypothetical protein